MNTSKIKGRLREMGKTQAELAKHIGIAVSTANQKLNGERPLDIYEAEKIADFLKIPESEFCDYFFSTNSAQRRIR